MTSIEKFHIRAIKKPKTIARHNWRKIVNCTRCGKETADYSDICQDCRVSANTPQKGNKWKPVTMMLLVISSIIIPIFGIVMGVIGISDENKKKQGIVLLILSLSIIPFIFITTAVGVNIYLRYFVGSRSAKVQEAIQSIRSSYRNHKDNHGSYTAYTIEDALQDTNIRKSVLRQWTFQVVGNPPAQYIATSTGDFPAGEGHQITYDEITSRFYGYGVYVKTGKNIKIYD